MAQRKENVVMFPFMATSHIIPFIALALRIEQTKKYTVTFVNNPLNIQKFRSSIPPNSNIRLVELPFYQLRPRPPAQHREHRCHALPPSLIRLLEASNSLKPSFKKLMEDLIKEQHGHCPLCIIAGIFFGWTASLAKELNVFHGIFTVSSAYGLACYYSLWMNMPHKKVNSDEFLLPDFSDASRVHITQLPTSILEAKDDGTDAWSVFQKKNLPEWVNSGGILTNTVEQFDYIGLSYFKRKLGHPA